LQTNKKDWFSQDATNLLTLISAKKKSEQKYHHDPTNPTSIASVRSARTKVKQAIKDAKEKWIRKMINKLEKIDVDPFTAWQSSKLLLAGLSHHHVNTKDKYIQLKDKNGKLTAKPADQVQIQGEFFSNQIFGRNSSFEPAAINKLRTIPVNTAIAAPITLDELKTALKKAKNRKAPGPNGIIIEQYKLLDDENLTFILEIINNYVDDPNYDIPAWHDVSLKLLPKKGDLSLPKNYRPISLLDVLSKILSSIMVSRMNDHLEKNGLQEQAGFMKGRGCSDATATLKMTLQNLRAANQDSFVLFVDIVKAFDSVNRDMLWKILEKYGIPEKIIQTIKKMYTDIKIKISIEDAEFIFNSISGVKQGDNLAPVLFLFVVQAAIETMHANWSTMNIATPDLKFFPSEDNGCLSIRSSKKSSPLHHNATLYADDSAFIFLSKADLITGTTFVKDTFAQFGLEVHLGCTNTPKSKSKTEAMYFPAHSKPIEEVEEDLISGRIIISGDKFVDFTNKFKYLGTYLAQNLSDDTDVDDRITAASKNFNALGKELFRNRKISLHIRCRLFVATTINILLWGCDTWAITRTQLNKIEVFHRRCIRQMIGITMHHVKEHEIKNEYIYKKSNLKSAETYIRIRQLRFLTRIAHMDPSRLPRQVINSQATANGRCSKNVASTKRAYKMALEEAGLFEKGKCGGIKTSLWIDCLRNTDTAERIEANLGLTHGTFKKGRKEDRRRKNTY